MFSSVDAGDARHLHAFVLRPGLLREIQTPEELRDLARRVRTLPSDANLRAFASEIARRPTPDHGAASAVRVQVFGRRYDPETLAPSGRLVRAIEIPLGDR